MSGPSKEEALQFALMLRAGLPSSDALLYFVDGPIEPIDLRDMHERWIKSRNVREAILNLQGKPWHEMDLQAQMTHALDLHYAQLAYFLYSHNYSELGGPDKTKADTARTTLEAKLAGQAGKVDAFTRFFEDLKANKLTLGAPITRPSQLQ